MALLRIHCPEGVGPHTDRVFPETLSTHIKARDYLAEEAEALAAFIGYEDGGEMYPPELPGGWLFDAEEIRDGQVRALYYRSDCPDGISAETDA